MSERTNRLAKETSPYLLQHAHNPVDWFAWGEEAFAEARRRNVPIFLSIGYSTCYWCHVMERECFESEAIADQMGRDFVCIKVDREERPDIDDIYMAATQMTTGHGGWPMSVFLEPSRLRPFYCGTYFPPEPRAGMRSFPQILTAIAEAWKERREEVLKQSETLAAAVTEHLSRVEASTPVGLEHVSRAAQTLMRMFDGVHGGFGSAPKFPQPVFLEFLLDIREAAADDATRTAVDHAVRLTLDKMACGGMNDQVGGGFHRYSVDERWLVPHFEKMLYDNAQFAAVYARAAVMYGDDFYRRTVRRTIEYVLREMTQPTGSFSSAQDAEVDGREGGNYIWRTEEFDAVLGSDDAAWAKSVYGLDDGPNSRDPHHLEAPPSNVLHLRSAPREMADRLNMSERDFYERLDRVNIRLYEVRSARKQPRLDDKVLTGWNGLMIGAMARAAVALNEPRYFAAAASAANHILASMLDSSGDLLRTSRAGTARIPAFLKDYAFFIDGLLAMHDAQAKSPAFRASAPLREPLQAARDLASRAMTHFGAAAGFFDTRGGQQDLFVRPRSTHDGAVPSGAAIMLMNLIELHRHTGDVAYLDLAKTALGSVSASIGESPVSSVCSVRALLRLISDGSLHDQAAPMPVDAQSAATFTPVEIYASEERIQVGTDAPAQLRLVLRIAEGYHINAADPGPGGASLVPLRIGVINGTGIAAYADYPAGAPYGPANDLRVYKGSVEFDVAVERSGQWSGRPLLSVTFQACTDTECLAPTTAELDVAIDRID